jgi:hypothetical protein
MKGLTLVVVLLASMSAYGQTTQQVSKAFESNRAQVNVIQMAMVGFPRFSRHPVNVFEPLSTSHK